MASSAPGGLYTELGGPGLSSSWVASATASNSPLSSLLFIMTPSTDAIDWWASDCRAAACPKSTLMLSSADSLAVGGAEMGDAATAGGVGGLASSASEPAARNASRMLSKFGVPSLEAVVLPKSDDAPGS